MRTTVIVALALATFANVAAIAATPQQVARATEAVKVAQCKLEWMQSGNTDKLAMYRFMADCLAR